MGDFNGRILKYSQACLWGITIEESRNIVRRVYWGLQWENPEI